MGWLRKPLGVFLRGCICGAAVSAGVFGWFWYRAEEARYQAERAYERLNAEDIARRQRLHAEDLARQRVMKDLEAGLPAREIGWGGRPPAFVDLEELRRLFADKTARPRPVPQP